MKRKSPRAFLIFSQKDEVTRMGLGNFTYLFTRAVEGMWKDLRIIPKTRKDYGPF